jgi:hypothetical protein
MTTTNPPKLESFYSLSEGGQTCYTRPDLGGILTATVRDLGPGRVLRYEARCYIGPEEAVDYGYATEEMAHAVAIRHSEQL